MQVRQQPMCAVCAFPAGPSLYFVPRVCAGVLIPKVFNIFTVVVKFASCVLCVASGLPVGPEGPMIHMGAAIGAALSQGHSTTLGFTTNIFRRFRNPRDKRDFVTAGVAVGVATAFNAPIGGLLFAFEEVASFWKHSLGWQVRMPYRQVKGLSEENWAGDMGRYGPPHSSWWRLCNGAGCCGQGVGRSAAFF